MNFYLKKMNTNLFSYTDTGNRAYQTLLDCEINTRSDSQLQCIGESKGGKAEILSNQTDFPGTGLSHKQ